MAGKFDVCAEVTQAILDHLEAGVVPWRQPWDAGGVVALPVRVTGEPYRGVNVVLLWQRMIAKGYRHPTWMTYRQAAALGGQVRKGEKSTMVVKVGSVVKPGEADAARHTVWIAHPGACLEMRRIAIYNLLKRFAKGFTPSSG